MNRIIYGIGGGDMAHERMEIHYARIAELARKQFDCETPVVAILPTAHHNGTNERIGRGWMDLVVEKFESEGCSTEFIWIGNQLPEQKEHADSEVGDILRRSHAVFVLGGDSQYLLEVVRIRKLEPLFKQAIADGKIMSGTSAGLIWLSRHCMSDSECFHKEEWNYIMLEGLDVLPFAINVHDNGAVPEGIIDKRSRKEQFEERFLELEDVTGLAVDEMVGLEIVDGICTIRTADESIGADVIAVSNGQVRRRRVETESRVDLTNTVGLREFVLL